ncbi:MAG: recombinase family protein [Pyramidobacter sp.]
MENTRHQLTASCIKEPNDVWQQTTVLGIIRNEKYKGDLIQGKTFTVDPISHRRLNSRVKSTSTL